MYRPLLSESFANILASLEEKYTCKISKLLLDANDLIAELAKLKTYTSNEIWFQTISQTEIGKLVNEFGRMLHYRRNEHEISFLPKGKEPEFNSGGKWSIKNRQTSKPAKLIKKLITTKEFNEQDFEVFNNRLKAESSDGEFKIVTGNDIAKYYNCEYHYEARGTLDSSCMCESPSNYFDIYRDVAKMLIFIKDDKIKGRALLWEFNEKTYMDRIYTISDDLVNTFINYAIENKWNYRCGNGAMSTGDDCTFNVLQENGSYCCDHSEITIDLPKQYSRYPYVDSFRYMSSDFSYITNISNDSFYSLDSTEGGYGEDNYFCTCDHCNDEIWSEDDACWSNVTDEYYCNCCSKWSMIMCTYIPNNIRVSINTNNGMDFVDEDFEDMIEFNDEFYHINHDKVIIIDNVYYHVDDFVITIIDGEYYHIEDENIVKIDGEYYHVSSLDEFGNLKNE